MEFRKQRSERTFCSSCNQFCGLRSKYQNILGINVDLNDHSVLGKGETYRLFSMSAVDKASYMQANCLNFHKNVRLYKFSAAYCSKGKS